MSHSQKLVCRHADSSQRCLNTDEMAYAICAWQVCVSPLFDSCEMRADQFRMRVVVQALEILSVAYRMGRLTHWGCKVKSELSATI